MRTNLAITNELRSHTIGNPTSTPDHIDKHGVSRFQKLKNNVKGCFGKVTGAAVAVKNKMTGKRVDKDAETASPENGDPEQSDSATGVRRSSDEGGLHVRSSSSKQSRESGSATGSGGTDQRHGGRLAGADAKDMVDDWDELSNR